MANKDTGVVNIHGKEYLTVARRINDLRTDKEIGKFGIETEIVEANEEIVIMKATIKDTEGRIVATGHAEENRNNGNINKTSALENCETSAIGRALASLGLGGTEFASADEVANAISQQKAGQATYTNPALTAKKKELLDAVQAKGMTNQEFTDLKIKTIGSVVPQTVQEAQEVLDALSK